MPRDIQSEYLRVVRSLASTYCGRPITVDTMFSGTDIITKVLKHTSTVLDQVYGIALDFEHAFACEHDNAKQAFIMSQSKPKLLFEKSCHLQTTVAHDIVTG